jgi:Pyruvate/2-oxoacid:ferredoxin oxidoreductase gamma subunit
MEEEPRVIGGRFGLSSKEFTPAMVKAVFDELTKDRPKKHFTVGIVDDVTHLSLPYDDRLDIEPDDVVRAAFFGLGADGTVGANKNSIKIIGEETDNYAQGYFVYDSKKSGATTVSHLRFGPRPIRSPYLIRSANFVACHQFAFLEKFEVLELARPGAIFLLNAPYGPDQVWDYLPRELQEQMIEKRLTFYVIDAMAVARETGMGGRINTIMQTCCFFAVSGILPREEAIKQIKKSIEKTYSKKARRWCGGTSPRSITRSPTFSLRRSRARRPRPTGTPHPRQGPGFREAGDGSDDGRKGGSAAGVGLPGGRHLAAGDDEVGEAAHRRRGAGLGPEGLHPVQQVRVRLPARDHPRQGLRARRAGRGAGDIPVERLRPRVQGLE